MKRRARVTVTYPLGSTAIRFDLPGPGVVRLSVIDIQGRLVRRLMDGPRDAGTVTLQWDGSDATGRRVGADVYSVLLEAAGRRISRQVVLLS